MVVPISQEQILKTWLQAFALGDEKRLKALTAEDFEGSPDDGEPSMDRETFLTVAQGLWKACPDWQVEIDEVHAEEDGVVADLRIQGTQEEALDLTSAGMGWLPPTGRHFEVEASRSMFELDDGRVVRERDEDGALSHVLSELGL